MDFVEYVKIPLETTMKMPIYLRKAWIMRHNGQEHELEMQRMMKEKGGSTVMGEALNKLAALEQKRGNMGV